MRKLSFVFGAFIVLAVFGMIAPASGSAGVNVSINIPLPGAVIPAPPGLVVVPGSYVYYPPEVDVDIFFYHGYWYRPYRGGWYIASGYNGPWRTVGPRMVPRPVLDVRPGYRRLPRAGERMPYRVVERNWRGWERDRYWDRGREERPDRGGHRGWARGRGHGRGGDD